MHKILSLSLLLFASVYTNAQQKSLRYKDHLDYYSEHAKSTVLTKGLNFLADGNYVLKGSKEDFKFLLEKKLEIEQKHLVNVDSIYLYGMIKDSVKVNQWVLKYKAKKSNTIIDLVTEKNLFMDIDVENIKNILHYGESGKIQTLGKNYSGKRTMTYSDEYIYMGFYNTMTNPEGNRFTEREDIVISRESGDVKYKSLTTTNCGKYNLNISRTSKNISKTLETDIVFDDGDPLLKSQAGVNLYRAYIKESYNKGKLTAFTIAYTNQNKGEGLFSKLIDTVTYQDLIYRFTLKCEYID
ncbi:hypothetical protein ACLI09_06020 [Flavobacterium sp. RHBU_24]|uniref:hypothetical protein n=1 Tax=Flavobacterium sp. RHBU_24 TaxID=3391185 RepID=UPI003984E759